MTAEGRRLADYIARYATAAASVLAATLLAVIAFFYGDLPEQIGGLREQVGVMQVEIRVVKEQQQDLLEANRVAQNWRERLVAAEQRIDRHTDQIKTHETRIEKLEQPISIFGPKKK